MDEQTGKIHRGRYFAPIQGTKCWMYFVGFGKRKNTNKFAMGIQTRETSLFRSLAT